MSITHLFFDIGGVLGTNAWSTPQRRRAIERFGLDAAEFEQQHRDAVGTFEQGRMTLDEYLDSTVFYRDRDFSREAFVDFMLAEVALGISQAPPKRTLFIDDRNPNLMPAKALGMQTIHFTTGDQLAGQLAAFGVAA